MEIRESALHVEHFTKDRLLKLERKTDEIFSYIQEEESRLLPIIYQKIESITLIQNALYLTLSITLILLLLFILLPIIKSAQFFKSFFSHYSDSKERLDMNKLYFSEVKDIAQSVNNMLAQQESIEEDLLQSRDEAFRLQKVKDEFLSNMSHELRTPLNAIGGFSEILLKKLPEHKKIITPIVESSDHLLYLVSDILDLSKIQSGKFTINVESFNPHHELSLFVKRFSSQMQKKNIEFRVEIELDETLSLLGDWFRISQILNNFVSNALKFTPENGLIILKIQYIESYFKASVIDSGIGISKEAQSRILMPFEQSDTSTTKNYGGTGLGLSIATSITALMGGTFVLESEEGKGSSFSISIFLEEDFTVKVNRKEDELKDEEITFEGHVLIAEDNKTNQLLLSMLLDDVGISYDMANDGKEAVEMYAQHHYDMVLMDENMPNLSGVEAMQKIKNTHINVVPIIAVTANSMLGDKERLLNAGMDGFLSKPINNDELIAILREYFCKK